METPPMWLQSIHEWLGPLHTVLAWFNDLVGAPWPTVRSLGLDWILVQVVLSGLAFAAYRLAANLDLSVHNTFVRLTRGGSFEDVHAAVRCEHAIRQPLTILRSALYAQADVGVSLPPERYHLEEHESRRSKGRARAAALSISLVQFLSIPIYILEAMLRLNVRNLLVWSVLVFAEIQPEAIYSWFLRLKNRLPEKWPPPTTIVAIATLAGIVIAVVVLTDLRGRSEYHKQVSVKNRTRLSAMAYNAGKVDVAVQTLTREATRLVGWLLHDELETALQLENDNQPSDHPGEYLNRRGFGGYSMENTSFDWSREHPLRDHSLSAFKYGRRDLLSPCLASLDKLREPLSAAQEDGVYASLLSVAPKRLRDALLDIDWQSEWVSRLRSLEAEGVGDLFKNAVRSASTSDIPSGEPNESGLALEHAWRDSSDEFRERLSDVMYISQQLQGLSSGLRKLNRPSVTQRLVSVVGPK